MVQQLKDDLLHKRTRHTNLFVPHCEHVGANKFPTQNTALLDTYVTIKFRNMYKVEVEDIIGPDLHDPHDIFEANCRVVRCDISEPYRMIGITDDCQFILVTDSRYWETMVVQYPIQFNEFCGIKVQDQYVAQHNWINAVTLRVDNGEPCYSVIVEYLEDDYIRFVLGDECFSKLIDYFGLPDNDYDNRDPIEYNEQYVDLDGSLADDSNIIQFMMIDGGYPDLLKEIYTMARTDLEIVEMRKLAIKEKKIYGVNEN